jgi:hypothetical protein
LYIIIVYSYSHGSSRDKVENCNNIDRSHSQQDANDFAMGALTTSTTSNYEGKIVDGAGEENIKDEASIVVDVNVDFEVCSWAEAMAELALKQHQMIMSSAANLVQ